MIENQTKKKTDKNRTNLFTRQEATFQRIKNTLKEKFIFLSFFEDQQNTH